MATLLLARSGIILWVMLSVSAEAEVCQLCSCYGNRTDCSGRGLAAVPSSWPNSTAWIDLSRNQLTTVGPQAFLGLEGLIHLDLSWNSIANLNDSAFVGLSELAYLNLNENPLRYAAGLTDKVFAPLLKLQELHVVTSECPQRPLDRCLQDLQTLESLEITVSEGGHIGNTLGNLRRLDTLSLTSHSCYVGSLDTSDLRSLSGLPLRRLSLRNIGLNHLDPSVLKYFNRTLKKLDVSCNSLDNLPEVIEALRGSLLDTLLLDDAIDSFLPVEMNAAFFSSLGAVPLRILSVARNQYLQLDVGSDLLLYRMTNLRYLRFGYNQVLLRSTQSKETAIQAALFLLFNVSVLDVDGLFTLVGKSGLEKKGRFCREPDSLFSDHRLAWEADTLNYPLPDSFWIWLLAAAYRLKVHDEITMPPALTRLYAANLGGVFDTFSCSDRKIYFKNNIKIVNLSRGSLGSVTCNDSGLSSVTDLSLGQVGLKSFNSAYFSASSMPFLHVLDLHGNLLGPFVASRPNAGVFDGMRGIRSLDMSANGIVSMHREALFGLENVTFINLSRNNIATWDALISPLIRLKVLDISSNQLSVVSKLVMADFDSHAASVPGFAVYMTSNAIKCSCDSNEFLQWLTDTKVVHDVASCLDGSDTRLLDAQLLRELGWRCRGFQILITVLGVLPALLLPIVLWWACKWRIRYICYKCKRLCRRKSSPWPAGEVEVYVSFHENDVNTARKLCTFLESRLGISRVVTRHSVIVGYYELEQIATLIDECNVSIILISPEGLNDSRFEFEFYMALEKGVRCILPVILSESFVLTSLPRSIRKLLMSNNYLRSPSASPDDETQHPEEFCEPHWQRFLVVFEACLVNMIERQAIQRSRKMAAPNRDESDTAERTNSDEERLVT